MPRDQSAQSCLLQYHCNSRFQKADIYIQLPLSLWRLILGGCGLIYEIKLVKIELWTLLVPFNMILSAPSSLLCCLLGCFSPLHWIPDPQRQERRAEMLLQHLWHNSSSYLKDVLITHLVCGMQFPSTDFFFLVRFFFLWLSYSI